MNVLQSLVAKLKDWALRSNENGIPLPLLRDPKSDMGSYTLTMFWVSFNIAILTLIGKVTKFLGDVDYNNVLWLLGITGSFYLGRNFSGDGRKVTLGDKTVETKEEEK